MAKLRRALKLALANLAGVRGGAAPLMRTMGNEKRIDEDEGYLGNDAAGTGCGVIVLSAGCARLLIPADDVPLRPGQLLPSRRMAYFHAEAQGLDSEL